MTDKQKHYYEHYNGEQPNIRKAVEEDTPTAILDEEATALLEDEATGILDEDEATGLLTETYDEETTLLEFENSVRFPTLRRVTTGEIISVNKPVFRIGKERSYVDYFVANNNAVSRSHADIVTRGTFYFVIDLNSKNRTYINNVAIPVQSEVQIRDGDCLRLGNEEFIFNTAS